MPSVRRAVAMLGVLSLAVSLLTLVALSVERNTDVNPLAAQDLRLPMLADAGVQGMKPDRQSAVEGRIVEVVWPQQVRVGDSEVVRLSLRVAGDESVPPTLEKEGGEPDEKPGPYATHNVVAIARLVSTGFEVDRPGDLAQPLLPGEHLTWRWTLAASEPGRQRVNLLLTLRFVPKAEGETFERLLWARTLTIETATVFGLSGPTAQALGVVGSVAGAVLGFPFVDKFRGFLWRRLRGKHWARFRR